MPVPTASFVACDLFVWPPPAPVAIAALLPKARRAKKPVAKKRKRKLRPAFRIIPVQTRTILDDRMEAAIEDGRIALCDEEIPCESLDVTRQELQALFRILLGDEHDPETVEALWRKVQRKRK